VDHNILIDPTVDYYAVLGVPRNASYQKIGMARKRLSLQYHPDRKTGDVEKFKAVQTAFSVLGSKEHRQTYNRLRREYQSEKEARSYARSGTRRARRRASSPFTENLRMKTLRDFVIDSYQIFQEKLNIEIPEGVMNNFKLAVEFVYNTWREVKAREERTGRKFITYTFAGLEISRSEIGRTDHLRGQ